MKKTIALIMAIVLCLSLCACGNANVEKAIVGEWKSLEGRTIVFNEDGTGVTPYGDGWFTWHYDKEANWYVLLYPNLDEVCTYFFIIVTENEIRSINIAGKTYYHADDYKKVAVANK